MIEVMVVSFHIGLILGALIMNKIRKLQKRILNYSIE